MFKGHWLKEDYVNMPKHTRIQVINPAYLSDDSEIKPIYNYLVCSTPHGMMNIPMWNVEEIPWWAS